jgi:hypothetical protein
MIFKETQSAMLRRFHRNKTLGERTSDESKVISQVSFFFLKKEINLKQNSYWACN